MRSVDVLIVSHNTRVLLADCLRSLEPHLARSDGVEVRVSVLDNASSDGSADMVAEEFPYVRLVRSHANLGFGRANNRLAATSGASHLLLLNSDTVVGEDVIGPLLERLESDPAIAVVGPRLVFPDGSPQFSSERFPTLSFELARQLHRTKLDALVRGRLERTRRTTEVLARESHDTDVLWATCWLVRRSDFERGLFDEEFPLYDEDLDLCRRLREQGRRIVYLASAELVHLGGGSSTTGAKQALTRRARARYYRRHGSLAISLAFLFLTWLTDAPRGRMRWLGLGPRTSAPDGASAT